MEPAESKSDPSIRREYMLSAVVLQLWTVCIHVYLLSLTEPCCPLNLTVAQVTQAMTNVSWSHAKGAHSFVTSLTSPRGHARCHAQDSHCLMGCITCGTNYTVTMEAFSRSGRKADCTYQGFSSSECGCFLRCTPTCKVEFLHISFRKHLFRCFQGDQKTILQNNTLIRIP